MDSIQWKRSCGKKAGVVVLAKGVGRANPSYRAESIQDIGKIRVRESRLISDE